MRQRLLVVEDDAIQQAVLKSALERRGYDIEVASDGLTAVRMLRGGGFDLALIDYRLPEIDGLASARLLREMMTGEDRPKLIALTSAADSLSSREVSESVFDEIVSKPLNLPALLSTIGHHLRETAADHTSRAATAAWQELGLGGAPSVIAMPSPSAAQAQLLRCYFDLSGQREPEAVLLLSPEAAFDAAAARISSPHFALPFVDLTGNLASADAHFSASDHTTWEAVASAITRFALMRQSIARGALDAPDIDTRLLAYMLVSGRPFLPSLDPASRECVRYPGFFPDRDARDAAERMAARGLLDRRFFERFHVCASCSSSRLAAREECPACCSSDLSEVPLVHHFRCAHQGPEQDFTRGPHLVCPKCRQHLRHYGSDYDKPGTAIRCGGCGALSPEPAVGFACLDCGSHTGGDAAKTRDAFSYALTAEGIALLRRGKACIAASSPGTGGPLPGAVLDALAGGAPAAALVELRYGARARIIARRGDAAFAAMRRLFLENLANSAGSDCMLFSGEEADHLLIRGASPEALAGLCPDLLEACQEVLAEGLEPEMRFIEVPQAGALK
jgi:CheY-like chemotaxis protein